jgi:hypothetical protein
MQLHPASELHSSKPRATNSTNPAHTQQPHLLVQLALPVRDASQSNTREEVDGEANVGHAVMQPNLHKPVHLLCYMVLSMHTHACLQHLTCSILFESAGFLAKSWFNLLLLGATMRSPCVVHAI